MQVGKKSNEWELTLNACVYRLATDNQFAQIYVQRGIPPKSWPDCIAKELALEFYEKKTSTSIAHAMIDLQDSAKIISRNELHHTFAVSNEQIIKAINTGNGLKLAKMILNEPSSYAALINDIEDITQSDTSVNIKEVVEHEFKAMLRELETTQNTNRTIGGYPLLSSLIGGFNDSRITLLVAGSGVGKTTFALNLVLSAIKEYSVLFINMEMSMRDMIKRITCINQGVPQKLLETRNSQVTTLMADTQSFLFRNENIFMTDGKNLSLEQISASIYKRASEGAKIVIVDYDQKIKMGMLDQEWKEILLAVEELEDVAKKTKTHIIILAQGDENNMPKASKRSMQPCSSVLAFYEEEGKYYIQSKKNRFGAKFRMLMNCDFNTYKIKEDREVNYESSVLERIAGNKSRY
jgi:replicative DNA helicase